MICKECRYWLDGPRPVCIRYPKWVPHEYGDPACGEFKAIKGAKNEARRNR